ncbi:NUDIX hydrolase [Bordetella tumulicola]|uniref:NUDIX hydrolase n=1 Tax=Bordetella tumulicola TaxID=1649133 RepID=UPI0039F13B64
MPESAENFVSAELVAVIVAVTQGEPRVLVRTADPANGARAKFGGLPSGAFQPGHRSLQAGMRTWVETQTHHPLGYVEQLYTFADHDRFDDAGPRAISVSYLCLTREGTATGATPAAWQDWYRYFPWEDKRVNEPAVLTDVIVPRLREWVANTRDSELRALRVQRLALVFGLDGAPWNEDMVLQRYELMYEAGLVTEAARHTPAAARDAVPGDAMRNDHRRILATGIARLRAKIKYRPVVFELLPPAFTLLQLQQTVEALAGRDLHKQNFRRQVEQQDLVEETGEMAVGTAGRPAKLFRFRRDLLAERAIAGSKLPLSRQA